jgi:hypothetical protein
MLVMYPQYETIKFNLILLFLLVTLRCGIQDIRMALYIYIYIFFFFSNAENIWMGTSMHGFIYLDYEKQRKQTL